MRDRLVDYQREWLHGLAHAAQLAVEEGHFRTDLDTDQFAYEFYSIILAFHHSSRLLRDERSDERAERQFERLIANSRAADFQTANSRISIPARRLRRTIMTTERQIDLEKSTNVRFPGVIRRVMQLGGYLAPGLASRRFAKMFLTPWRAETPDRERSVDPRRQAPHRALR